jgi:magnesium chelatase subunit D
MNSVELSGYPGSLIEKIRINLNKNRGLRIGETTVASKNVHTVDVNTPEIIMICTDADAGQVFYARDNPGEIIHMDVFHELGVVDHRLIALKIKEEFRKRSRLLNTVGEGVLNYVDVQTGSGGGRITGTLNYGKKESLRKAHLNHVHITTRYHEENVFFLLFLVEVVEEEIIRQGKEIRKIERIIHTKGNGKNKADLSPYSSDTDSLLKQDRKGLNEEISKHIKRELAVELTQKFGSSQDALQILDKMSSASEDLELYTELHRKYRNYQDILNTLFEKRIIEKNGRQIRLTDEGKDIKEYIKFHAKEIQLHINRFLKKIPLEPSFYYTTNFSSNRPGGKKKLKNLSVSKLDRGEWLKEIAVPETILSAIKRTEMNNLDFYIKREDIQEKKPYLTKSIDICLVIDSSASMTGERIKSAKFLAEYLVCNNKDRVSVITFQEKEVNVIVPFTRNFNVIQKNLSKIDSCGLTPLALAISKSVEYLENNKKRNPLMILITDGIPTVPLWSSDPVLDSIRAAEAISKKRIHFSCIGLQPNKRYLEKIAEKGKGSVYIVDELKKDILIYIANQERKAH